MSTKIYDFSKPEDIEDLTSLAFSEDENLQEDVNDSDESEKEDHVETRSVDSETDHVEVSDDDGNDHSGNQENSKDGTRWSKIVPRVTRARSHNMMKLPGVIGQTAINAETELDCRNLFFSNMLNMIVDSTNLYIESIKAKFNRERNCRPTDLIEIRALFGLLYLAGVFRGGHRNLKDFWASDGLGIDLFKIAMTEKRFRFLLRCLRFDDRSTREERREFDKLAAVRNLFSNFIENFKKHYHLGQNVTIDEMLPAYRGRCTFRLYIPSKPNKYGIKIFCLYDAKLYYTSNMEIYCEQQPGGPFRQSNLSSDVIMRLSEPISQSGRNITADNWFTSVELVRKLEEKKLSYVGTVRKNKRKLPANFVLPKGRQVFDSIFGYTKNETLVSYVPKNKSGVDVVDKLCATYNVARSTKRWPMKLQVYADLRYIPIAMHAASS
ncbi:piggyBac transposable element-derived protein 4-like [Diorhabda carinulata]|uniref:piggyBac transposable element-derived protein 4-like n=1 Tax=Diorhabda carinulata TaxID=1163345 RepID=UPI0025A2310B|nr:piggyBac transposable element-derived protein 4-like [Diorhabda carinulata]